MNSNKLVFTSLFTAIAFSLTLSTRAAELVVNGGFEQSAATPTGNNSPGAFGLGWTVNDSSGFSNVSDASGFSHSGNNYANLGGSASPPNPPPPVVGTLSQTLNTITSGLYTLSFWLVNDGDGSGAETFSVMFGATTMVINPSNANAFGPYTQYTFTNLTPTAGGTVLKFQYQNDGYFRLDDVSVQGPAAAPEAGGTLMFALIGGLFVTCARWAFSRKLLGV